MSSVFDPGRKERKRAAALAEQGIIKGAQGTGPGGMSFGFGFRNGQGSLNLGLGSFAPMLERLQAMAGGAFDQAAGGLPPEFQNLGQQSIDRLGNIDVQRIQNQGDFDALGELFSSAAATAQRDPFEMGTEISSRLRQLSERRNQRLVNKTFDRLNRSGKLGTTGGAGIAAELDANLFDEGLKFDLAGLDFGQRTIQDAFGRALGASQQREAIGNRQFAEEFALENLGGQRALQQFGIGESLFRNLLTQQAQGAGLGMQFLQGATGLSQLPLAFLGALQGSTAMQSGSIFDAAGIRTNLAQLAKSPVLEAINAAGEIGSMFTGAPQAPDGGT